jgi:outer membrane protein TolC
MRKIVFTLSLFAIMSQLNGKTYTLDNIINEAIENSKTIKIVQQELVIAASQVEENYGKMMPSVDVSINMSHSFATFNTIALSKKNSSGMTAVSDVDGLQEVVDSLFVVNDTLTGNILQTLVPYMARTNERMLAGYFKNLGEIPKNNASFGVTINQPIFSQGKIRIGTRIAKSYESTLHCKIYDEKIKVKASIIKLFFNSLLNQNNVRIGKDALALASDTHAKTVLKFRAGSVSELDTLTSCIALKTAQIDLKKTEKALILSYDTLIISAGLRESINDFSITGNFQVEEFSLPLDIVLDKMRNENNELKQLYGKESMQNEQVNLAKADFHPSILAGASISKIGMFNSVNHFNDIMWGDDQKIFAALNWNIFSGFTKVQRLNQAKAEREQFMLTSQQTKDRLELSTRNVYEQVKLCKEILGSNEDLVVTAERRYMVAKTEFETGNKTLLDLQSAELELNKVRIDNNISIFNYITALIDLKLLMGSL